MGSSKKYASFTCAVALLVTTFIAAAPPASSGTFSGANGAIALACTCNGIADSAIFIVNPDGTGLTQVTHPGAGVDDSNPSWSGDGRRIAFQRSAANRNDVWVVNADGSGAVAVTSAATAGSSKWFEEPSFSPDGSRIAITVSDQSTGSTDVATIATDGSGFHQITDSTVAATRFATPQWSPDGTRIAIRRSVERDYATIGSDGTGLSAMPGTTDAEYVSWAPNMQRIAFAAYRVGSTDVYVMNIDGTGATVVSHDGVRYDEIPQVSPDGLRIAYQNSGTPNALIVEAIDGTGPVSIVSAANIRGLSWQPTAAPPTPPVDPAGPKFTG